MYKEKPAKDAGKYSVIKKIEKKERENEWEPGGSEYVCVCECLYVYVKSWERDRRRSERAGGGERERWTYVKKACTGGKKNAICFYIKMSST